MNVFFPSCASNWIVTKAKLYTQVGNLAGRLFKRKGRGYPLLNACLTYTAVDNKWPPTPTFLGPRHALFPHERWGGLRDEPKEPPSGTLGDQ